MNEDELSEALRHYDEVVDEYVDVHRRIGAALPAPTRRRRRWPALLVVLVLTATLPAVVFAGRAHFVPAPSCVGVNVTTSDDLAALITANGTGTTFCLQAGTHRIGSSTGLSPKTGDKFIGVGQNVVLSGSKALTSWTVSGSNWYATGFLPGTAPDAGEPCAAATPMCNQLHDVFFDGTFLAPVASTGALATGKTYLDYAANRVYVRDDPTGHTIEQNWAARLFTGTGDDVQVKNLTLQGAASTSNTGAIDPASGATGWLVDHNEVRRNHGYGVGPGQVSYGVAQNMTATANNVHHNGQDGMGQDGTGNLAQANEIHHNSYAGYDPLWDAGNKWGAQTVTITGNYVHDEVGPGIWCDVDCEDATITNNYVAATQIGIMFEISCRASIHDNIVTGTHGTNWASIFISNSEGVEVYNNQTYDGVRGIWAYNTDRLTEPRNCTGGTEHVVKDLNVHDNDIDLNGTAQPFGGKAGLWNDQQRTDLYSTLNNTFQDNTYYDTTPNNNWDWGYVSGSFPVLNSFAQFQARGQDTAGSVVNSDPTPPSPPTLTVGPQP